MRTLICLILVMCSSVSLAIPCKLHRTDNMVFYGHCAKYKTGVVFKNLAGFTCQVSSHVTRALDEDDKKIDKISDQQIVKETILEHGEDLNKIPFCAYTK